MLMVEIRYFTQKKSVGFQDTGCFGNKTRKPKRTRTVFMEATEHKDYFDREERAMFAPWMHLLK